VTSIVQAKGIQDPGRRILFIYLFLCCKTSVDVHMTSPPCSPPPAHGSSRATGGSTRGRAVGNVYNFADAGDDDNSDTLVLRTGKVHVYNSPVDPINVKPFRILKVDVQFSMAPVLKSIAAKWSPIESMGF